MKPRYLFLLSYFYFVWRIRCIDRLDEFIGSTRKALSNILAFETWIKDSQVLVEIQSAEQESGNILMAVISFISKHTFLPLLSRFQIPRYFLATEFLLLFHTSILPCTQHFLKLATWSPFLLRLNALSTCIYELFDKRLLA